MTSTTVEHTASTTNGSTLAPPALTSTHSFRASRPEIVGPEEPEAPFPIIMSGPVQRGFGRGGKELGCPTANLPEESLPAMSSVTSLGVYYGYAQVIFPSSSSSSSTSVPPPPSSSTDPSSSSSNPPPAPPANPIPDADRAVQPMVMSLGKNPFYKNEHLSAEIHIMHNFANDFYGREMRVVVLGYIRPELDYTSRDDLINDIEIDKHVAVNCLQRPAYAVFHDRDAFAARFT